MNSAITGEILEKRIAGQKRIVALEARIAELEAKLSERDSYIANFEHATKLERAELEADKARDIPRQ